MSSILDRTLLEGLVRNIHCHLYREFGAIILANFEWTEHRHEIQPCC